MSFQSGVNQAIGTVGALAGVKKVVEGQQEANKLAEESNTLVKESNLQSKVLEAQQDEMNANDALLKSDSAIIDREVSEKGYANAIKDPDKALDARYGEAKAQWDEASKDYEKRMAEYELFHTQKSKPSSKRLDKANKAMDELNDEITARKNLKFDLEIAKKNREAASLELKQLREKDKPTAKDEKKGLFGGEQWW